MQLLKGWWNCILKHCLATEMSKNAEFGEQVLTWGKYNNSFFSWWFCKQCHQGWIYCCLPKTIGGKNKSRVLLFLAGVQDHEVNRNGCTIIKYCWDLCSWLCSPNVCVFSSSENYHHFVLTLSSHFTHTTQWVLLHMFCSYLF